AAGFMEGQEQASLRAAIFLLCGSSDWRGGRHASHGRTVTIVEEKQLVTQRRTLFQKTDSLSRVALVGTNRSAPYVRIGRTRPAASLRHIKEERPMPGGARRLMIEKAP